MELIGKLGSNNITKIGILPSASKEVSIKFADQCLHIINNKERMDSKVEKRYKIENHYSNINHIYIIFKRALMLITEV